MYSVKGWPVAHTEGYASTDMHADDLSRAKADSIPFEDEYPVKRMILHLVDYTPNNHVDEIWMNAKWPRFGDPKPDSFVEIEGEVTSVWQFKLNDKWHDFSSEAVIIVNRYANEGAETRQVARMKLAEAVSVNESLTAQQINHECQKHNDELMKQLAEANARIKELEQWKEEELLVWDPVLDYAQENSERLGIRIGQSISTGILNILKAYNTK